MRYQTRVRGHTIYFLTNNPNEANLVENLVHTIGLTGDESFDRMLIQSSLCDIPCFKKCNFYYDGNIVYPFDEIIANFVRIKRDMSLSHISYPLLQFLFMNFDKDKYDFLGHIGYYKNSFENLWNELISSIDQIPETLSDVRCIANQMFEIMR